jgi:ribosomal protein S18 acetylase RimI-like enzyme
LVRLAIVVVRDVRRQAIARQLIQFAIQERGVDVVAAEVHQANRAS